MAKKLTNIPALSASVAALAADLERLKSSMPTPPALPDDLVRQSDIPEPPDLAPICQRVDDLAAVADKLADMIPTESTISEIADARAGSRVGPVKGRLTQLWNDLAAEKARVDALDESLGQLSTIRSELSETRRWLSDMGTAWQSHKRHVEHQVSAIEAAHQAPALGDDSGCTAAIRDLADRIAAIESAISEHDPTGEIAGIRSAVQDIASRQCPVVDLSGVESRLSDVESRQCPAPVDISGVLARLDALESRHCPDVSGQSSAITSIVADIAAIKQTLSDITGGDA